MQAGTNRSWTIAAASAAAGAAALSFGLFLAVASDGLAGDTTDKKEKKSKTVQIVTVGEDGDTDVEAVETPDGFATAWSTGGRGAYLGLSLHEDTKHSEGGALVEHVVTDSPAAKAGLKDGDVIVGFGGDIVRGPRKVTEKLRASKPGDKVILDIRRDNRIQKMTIELVARPGMSWRVENGDFAPFDEDQRKALEESLKGLDEKLPDLQKRIGKMKLYAPGRHGMLVFGNRKPLLGIEMVETTPELRESMGGSKDAGVLVGKVLAGSAAEKCGLKVGDLITSIESQKVADVSELVDAVSGQEGKTIDIDVVRDKRTIHLKAVLPRLDEPEDEPTGPRASVWRIPVAAPLPALPPVPPTPPAATALAPLPPAVPALPAMPARAFSLVQVV